MRGKVLRTAVALGGGAVVAALLGGCASSSTAASGPTSPTARTSTAATAGGPGVEHLVPFQHLTVDPGLSAARQAVVLQRIGELYTFWDTGDVQYLYQSDSPDFVDHTLPVGREQGRAGIVAASQTFRTAVPDLRCTVADVLVSGDEVSVRQVYSGHFTGTYQGVRGHGQPVSFIAFDIQQVGATQIVGDWHLEDDLTFLQQIGLAPAPTSSTTPTPSATVS